MDGSGFFDFSRAIAAVCCDMCRRLPELQHIDVQRVAFGVSQTRRNVSHGLYASLTPLRFEHGAAQKSIRGRRYGVEPVVCDATGQEFLYILTVYLPRFMNTQLEEKLVTLMHELWHISPAFNGDLRRHEGRCYAHGPSQAAYDAEMALLAQQWLSADPPESIYEFLSMNFAELAAEYGQIVGDRYANPRLIPA